MRVRMSVALGRLCPSLRRGLSFGRSWRTLCCNYGCIYRLRLVRACACAVVGAARASTFHRRWTLRSRWYAFLVRGCGRSVDGHVGKRPSHRCLACCGRVTALATGTLSVRRWGRGASSFDSFDDGIQVVGAEVGPCCDVRKAPGTENVRLGGRQLETVPLKRYSQIWQTLGLIHATGFGRIVHILSHYACRNERTRCQSGCQDDLAKSVTSVDLLSVGMPLSRMIDSINQVIKLDSACLMPRMRRKQLT